MEFLVKDIASRLGFPLRCGTEAGSTPDFGVNNPSTAVAAQPSLEPPAFLKPDHFSQLLPNSALYGANSYMLNHEASISPPFINQPYSISRARLDFGLGGPSTSAHMGYVGGDQNVCVAYQSALFT